jgi:O-antigen/teichoic acid export membrane protein
MYALKKYYGDHLYLNSMALMLNTGIASLFNFLFWMVAGRSMPPESVGLATAAVSAAAMIVTLSRLGLDAALVRYFPGARDREGFYNAIMAINLLATITISGIFIIGLNVFSPPLEFLRGWQFFPAFMAYVLLTAACSMQGTALVAIRKAYLSLVQGFILAVRIPLLYAASSAGVLGVIESMDFAYLAMLVIGIFLLYRLNVSGKLGIDLASVQKSLGFSLGNYVSTILTIAPITLIPVMAVNTIGASEGAYFYIAYSIATFLLMVPDAVSMSLFVEGSHGMPLKENTVKSIRFTFMVMAPMALLIMLFGDRLLAMFGSPSYAKALPTLQMLAISSFFSAITSIYSSVKKVQKDMATVSCISLAASASTIGLGYLFLITYGLDGIGYAWLISNAVVCAVVCLMMAFRERWTPS